MHFSAEILPHDFSRPVAAQIRTKIEDMASDVQHKLTRPDRAASIGEIKDLADFLRESRCKGLRLTITLMEIQ